MRTYSIGHCIERNIPVYIVLLPRRSHRYEHEPFHSPRHKAWCPSEARATFCRIFRGNIQLPPSELDSQLQNSRRHWHRSTGSRSSSLGTIVSHCLKVLALHEGTAWCLNLQKGTRHTHTHTVTLQCTKCADSFTATRSSSLFSLSPCR